MSAAYSVGIDLGTTHSALSWKRLDAHGTAAEAPPVVPVPQLTSPGTVEALPLLPSFLYLPADGEFPKGALDLPWSKNAPRIAGALARSHGAKVPGRLVASAKSWLGHTGVDRHGAILPWQAPPDVARLSPVQAAAEYLGHLSHAWSASFGKEAPLAEQQVTLTVPASFDPAARELTLEAARLAGLGDVTLLEEPQAALYAWLQAKGDAWRKQLVPGDVLLVIDVGGGTSDFTLISVTDDGAGNLALERLAVGDHILLGGDNMDLALAYRLNESFAAQGKTLDAWQLQALTHQARGAKEQLFEKPSPASVPVAVASRGSSLLGGTLKTELSRAQVVETLVDGFFPVVGSDAAAAQPKRGGLQQVGLPYAADAGITRHLAGFLRRQAAPLAEAEKIPSGSSFVKPTAVLFNGGVFKAQPFRERVLDVLRSWAGQPVRELDGADLDLAVARGAASYGWVKAGHGLRIRGGTARSFYVGVEAATLAVPGVQPKVKALCVAPFGMEEGSQADVPPQEFALLVGEPTTFRFFASSTRRNDAVGVLLDSADGLDELPPLETTLEGHAGGVVPVNLQAAVTELGALELRCLEHQGKRRWKLELDVRGQD